MESWGITMRQSDYGLELLESITEVQLKRTNFAVFNVSEALELVKADILDEIRRANPGCSAEVLSFYISTNFPRNFTLAALLIAECLVDYYRAGELIVYQYDRKTCELSEHSVKKFIVADSDLKILLTELQNVQNPKHWLYQSWFREETRRAWMEHIQSVFQTLSKHTDNRKEARNG